MKLIFWWHHLKGKMRKSTSLFVMLSWLLALWTKSGAVSF